MGRKSSLACICDLSTSNVLLRIIPSAVFYIVRSRRTSKACQARTVPVVLWSEMNVGVRTPERRTPIALSLAKRKDICECDSCTVSPSTFWLVTDGLEVQ